MRARAWVILPAFGGLGWQLPGVEAVMSSVPSGCKVKLE